ncbi:hypothetical protein AALO_G00035780 [Alosa alosa]|uniref:V-SNARE coiled-coil homology domain-containing protein n=1 Tax=Alosa alosa TaxID=278164 RepID=A0AAV6H716_9TELE|nr:hypothetical protein AALO_G00035780 [Alosa alosa]
MVNWCPQSRLLCVAGISANLILFRLSRHEANTNITALEVRLHCDMDDVISPLALGNCNGLAVVDYLQKTVLLCMSTLDLYGPADPFQRLTHSPRKNRQSTSGLTELSDNQVSLDMERSKSPTSVPYPPSLHNDQRVQGDGLSSLRPSHYSPVFYLLDNVKGPGRKLSLPTDLKPELGTACHSASVLPPLAEASCSDWFAGSCSDCLNQSLPSTASAAKLVNTIASQSHQRVFRPYQQSCEWSLPEPRVLPAGRCGRRGANTRAPGREEPGAGLGETLAGSPSSPVPACMEISLPVATHTEGYASRRAMLQQLHGVSMYSHDEHHSTSYCWSERAESRENSFSRSRSSSVSSIDRDTKEAVSALQFGESYGRKGDALPTPCLWVGTSLGLVLLMPLSIPTDDQERMEDPVTVAPTGTVLMLKGSVLRFAFLDCGGAVMQTPYEVAYLTPTSGPRRPRRRLACLYVHNITEASFVIRADIVSVSTSICLACFLANGHVMTLSLPSLRPLLDVNYLPLTDMRIARTFCFSHGGQALYLNSPTEIQRITYSQDMCDNLQEMLGELFIPIETPEAQNRGFLKGFFGGSAQTFDREELFGEAAAGKASGSLAKHIPGQGGMEGMKVAASGVVGDLARARIALDERGQRLGELEDRTALMMTSAECFSKNAHALMLRCKDKKWYQW